MNIRSIGAGILGLGLLVGILTACGDDSSSAGPETSSTPVSSPERPSTVPKSTTTSPSPTTGSDSTDETDEIDEPDGSGVTTNPDRPGTPVQPRPTTPPVDDGPHDLLGNIAIWTTAGDNPLNGAAFDVASCGETVDVGAVDMSGQSRIDVPVSIGCWIVGLTRTPEGYALADGPSQKTVYLDARTNEVILNFRFVATGHAAPVQPNDR